MAEASDFEQSLLEQINFARLAPLEDFARYIVSYNPLTSTDAAINSAFSFFGVDGIVLKSQIQTLTSVQPLVWNETLADAAMGHTLDMIDNGVQAHTIGDSTLQSRVTDAGYNYRALGENIYAYSKSPLFAHAGFMVDWGFTDTGIQTGAGHRANIMRASFREVGIGVAEVTDRSVGLGPYVVTQDFGTSVGMPETVVLGVTRDEIDGDGFYSIGEGRGGITVLLTGGGSDVSAASGGYDIGTTAGLKTLIFSGGGLSQPVSVTADLPTGNAKLDLIDGTTLWSSVSLLLGTGAGNASFIGDNGIYLTGNEDGNRLKGNRLDNQLDGKGGRDQLIGGKGSDVLLGGSQGDVLRGGPQSDTLMGQNGRDKLIGGAGKDALTGGAAKDVFVFKGANFGKDTITDYVADRVVITSTAEASTLAELSAALTEVGGNAVYDHLGDGKNVIVFEGISVADLDLTLFSLG